MLYTPVEFHRVRTATDYRALVESAMAKRRAHGFPDAALVEVATPVTAYINHGRWVIDCECGAGNMVHPEWQIAGCLACGAIHTRILLPDPRERVEIERLLNDRPREVTRNWDPSRGETASSLRAENAERGVRGRA